jgi:hypothetical protein
MEVCLLAALVPAQTMITPNPADVLDARLNLVNPAAVPFQDPIFTAGLQALHIGVGENAFSFRNNFFGLTTTDRQLFGLRNLGWGVQGQVLNTPVMNDLSFNAIASTKIGERVGLGVSIGALNRSFSNFEGADLRDPLLQQPSEWALLNVGVGVLVNVNRYLKLGASANKLNRPNLAFQDNSEVRLDRYLSAGALVGFSHFAAGLSFFHENEELSSQIFLQALALERGYLKVGYSSEAVAFEGQLHVVSGVSVNYRYNYPINDLDVASDGSHELGLIFNFKKRALPYEPEWVTTNVPLPPAISLADAFTVHSSIDTVAILDTYIFRQVDTRISVKERADLPRAIFYSASSPRPETPDKVFLTPQQVTAYHARMSAARLLEKITTEEKQTGRFSVPRDSIAIIKEMEKNHTKNYLIAFRNLAGRLREPNFTTTVIVPPDARRAHLILRYLGLYGPITDNLLVAVADSAKAQQQNYLGADSVRSQDFERKFSAPATVFDFNLNLMETVRWGPVTGSLLIEDALGKVWFDSTVARRKSKNDQPQILQQLVWDWKVKDGGYPDAGNYYYYLVWKSADGNTYRSPKRKIVVDRRPERIYQKVLKQLPEKMPSSGVQATVHLNQ